MKIVIEITNDSSCGEFQEFLAKLHNFLVKDENRSLVKEVIVE